MHQIKLFAAFAGGAHASSISTPPPRMSIKNSRPVAKPFPHLLEFNSSFDYLTRRSIMVINRDASFPFNGTMSPPNVVFMGRAPW